MESGKTAGFIRANLLWMKFLCDEMLKGLARWLRAAGYDTAMEPAGTPDRILIGRAQKEQRILLTRDRKLLEYKTAGDFVVLLKCNAVDECIDELSTKLSIDWLYRPFSRCLNCNTPLIEAKPEQWQQVPEFSRQQATLLRYCPNCRQLFWDGSHEKRMRSRLEQASGP